MSDSKVSITITNRAPGLQPPLYVAGSFSNPEWVPEPMDYTISNDGVHTFTKTLRVEPESKIVYKFRAGEGDWWLLNEDAPTVTDDAGNRNNILEAPKATQTDVHVAKPAEANQQFIETVPQVPDSCPKIEQTQPVSHVQALKHLDEADQTRSSTPEFIKTINEVAESAALLDRSTPEPEAPEVLTGKKSEQSTALLPNAADTAAEVADSAALLDRPTPEPEVEVDVIGQNNEAPSEVAAQVADTAANLDTEDDKEAPSEVAAQVANTAAKLDSDELKVSETVSPIYKNLADVKVGRKDESLDIAGFSNDNEPVPLFAHECAGLYEDDEIPGVDEQGLSSLSGRFHEHSTEDYDDPTLERFPSTRDEIMSTVRKVETGLNADQVTIEGVPISPIVQSRSSPTGETRNEPPVSETSPVARGQQHLSLPPSLTAQKERSLSATSLHSIAEDAEGAEERDTAQPQSEYIADVVETSNGPDKADEIAKKAEAERIEKATANKIAPVVEQAETADDIIENAQVAEGEQSKDNGSLDGEARTTKDAETLARSDADASLSSHKPTLESLVTVPSPSVKPSTSLLSPVSDDDEAVVVKSTKGKDEIAKTGYLTPERAATPQPEEPGSPREPVPNTADPIAESEIEPSVLTAEADVPLSEPQSPQIVVSKPEETQPDEELLPAATLGESLDVNGHTESEAPSPQDSENLKKGKAAKVEEGNQASREVGLSDDTEPPLTTKSVENVDAYQASQDTNEPNTSEEPQEVAALQDEESHKDTLSVLEGNGVPGETFKDTETSDSLELPATVNDSQKPGPHGDNTATASARDNHTGTLKQRSVAQSDPIDRTNTPISITDSHKEAAKAGNWFSAFLRLVFIDFFGGFVRKLYGRKTLVMTAVVLGAVAYASFRRITETEGRVASY